MLLARRMSKVMRSSARDATRGDDEIVVVVIWYMEGPFLHGAITRREEFAIDVTKVAKCQRGMSPGSLQSDALLRHREFNSEFSDTAVGRIFQNHQEF
jgi:hypothetical protein